MYACYALDKVVVPLPFTLHFHAEFRRIAAPLQFAEIAFQQNIGHRFPNNKKIVMKEPI